MEGVAKAYVKSSSSAFRKAWCCAAFMLLITMGIFERAWFESSIVVLVRELLRSHI